MKHIDYLDSLKIYNLHQSLSFLDCFYLLLVCAVGLLVLAFWVVAGLLMSTGGFTSGLGAVGLLWLGNLDNGGLTEEVGCLFTPLLSCALANMSLSWAARSGVSCKIGLEVMLKIQKPSTRYDFIIN
jgi:hypothetical protein